jgi:hypothetical protein
MSTILVLVSMDHFGRSSIHLRDFFLLDAIFSIDAETILEPQLFMFNGELALIQGAQVRRNRDFTMYTRLLLAGPQTVLADFQSTCLIVDDAPNPISAQVDFETIRPIGPELSRIIALPDKQAIRVLERADAEEKWLRGWRFPTSLYWWSLEYGDFSIETMLRCIRWGSRADRAVWSVARLAKDVMQLSFEDSLHPPIGIIKALARRYPKPEIEGSSFCERTQDGGVISAKGKRFETQKFFARTEPDMVNQLYVRTFLRPYPVAPPLGEQRSQGSASAP